MINDMEKNWKLSETLTFGIFNDLEVIISDPSLKSNEKELNKKVDKLGGKKIILENNNFSIRICGVNLIINHPSFPNELILQNQTDICEIIKIISQTNVDHGKFEGDNWSLLMDSNKNFIPAKEGISIYDVAEVEMIRRFSLSNSSKTSKWEPGYSYCDENETFYYLGTINSWIEKESTLVHKYGPQQVDGVHMVLDSNSFKPKAGVNYTTSELIRDYFGKIKFLNKKSTLIKIKTPFAKNDFTKMVPILETIIDNWKKENETTYSNYSKLITYKEDLYRIFKCLEYSTLGEPITLSVKSIEQVKEILENQIKFYLVKYWQKNLSFENISKEELNDQIQYFLEDNFKESSTYNKVTYFTEMFKKVANIDLEEIFEKNIQNFDPTRLSDTWENYVNNIINVVKNPGELTDFFIDESFQKNSWYYGYHQRTKTEFNDAEKKVFNEIIKYCRENSKSTSEYCIRNAGTISNPRLIEQYTITLDTVFNMYGNDVPQEVQEVLINGKFMKVIIKADYKNG